MHVAHAPAILECGLAACLLVAGCQGDVPCAEPVCGSPNGAEDPAVVPSVDPGSPGPADGSPRMGPPAAGPVGGAGPNDHPADTDSTQQGDAPGPVPVSEPAGPAARVGDSMDPDASSAGASGDSDAGIPSMTGPAAESALWYPDAAWDCGMPEGIPAPGAGEPLFTVELDVEVLDLGQTQFGRRRVLNAKAGTVSGPAARGEVVAGAYDYELLLDNGVVEIEQIGVLRLNGGNVYFRNCGVAPDIDTPARVVADFEAATRGEHAGLNEGRYIGERTFDSANDRLVLAFFSHTGSPDGAGEAVSIPAPSNPRRQAWDCEESEAARGDLVYRESVGIGGSVSVGASKHGNRNIIPITGGSSRDRLPGTVLSGGADYQLSSGGFFLDARYVIRSEDGVLVAVRNCGPASALVPTFETRTDGPYAFLNENKWLSSSPSIAIGAVNLTIYERL